MNREIKTVTIAGKEFPVSALICPKCEKFWLETTMNANDGRFHCPKGHTWLLDKQPIKEEL